LSGLTKKAVTADQTLGTILGVSAGTMVSYADIQKGLHEYIRKHNLKGEHPQLAASGVAQAPAQEMEPAPVAAVEEQTSCASCGATLPISASFCDQCGASQE
jgi:hypothetical protein